MKIVQNRYQKTLGYAVCTQCKSVLCIQKTDVQYKYNGGKTVATFTCAACGSSQEFMRKNLLTRKKALGLDKV